jgi:asparaginyl-tRNA synthetase
LADSVPGTAAEVLAAKPGEKISLKGWVFLKNRVGGVVFLTLRDGSGYVQISAKKGVAPEPVFEAIKDVTRESAVEVGGEVKEDRRAPGGK